MYELAGRELRFALVLGSSHFTQHVYYRILPPLIPVLSVALSYPLWQLGSLITLYSMGLGVAQAPLGVMSDRLDRRYLLPTGLAVSGASYVLFAAAPYLGGRIPAATLLGYRFEGSFLVMSLSMVIVGVGLAVVHPTGYPLITDNVSDANKGKVLGIFGASSRFGDAATPAVIAILVVFLSWQQVILLFGVTGVVYGIVLYSVLKSDVYETTPAGRKLEEAESTHESSSGDRRTYLYPMTAVYLYFISVGLTSRGLNTFLPSFLVVVYAYSFQTMGVHVGAESIANIFFALMLVGGAVVQIFLGGLIDEYDSRLIILNCMLTATIGVVVLAAFDLPPILLAVIVIVLGSGMFGVNPARDALISDITPPEHEGRTFGFIFTAAGLTGAPLPMVIGYVLEAVGMRTGFLFLAIGPVLGGVFIASLYSERVYVPGEMLQSNVNRPE